MNRLPKGYALHIGINRLSATSSTYNPNSHQRSDSEPIGKLRACENDAQSFAHLCVQNRFHKVAMLLTEHATKDNFFSVVERYSRELRKGDLFVITFSGHGGQIPDQSGDDADGLDEVWCFHDTIVIDDELYELWKLFDEGVRIVVLSDSCHSGDILKHSKAEQSPQDSGISEERKRMFQRIPEDIQSSVKASIQVLAACRSDQLARESFTKEKKWFGAFSNCVLKSYEANEHSSYSELFDQAQACVTGRQQPFRSFLGQINEAFFHGPAFRI